MNPKEDNEEIIKALGIKEKYAKRRREQATFLGKKKPKSLNSRQQLAVERNKAKATKSKARLQCRPTEFNEKETEKEKEAPWPCVTWRGLGMEPYLEHPTAESWRDNMAWPKGVPEDVSRPFRSGSEFVEWNWSPLELWDGTY